MLYPLTDNLLDDPEVPALAKRAFNERFGRRLAGQPVTSCGAREAQVLDLVARIEGEFPRSRFGDVHESLLAIHRGQALSLEQQDDSRLPDAEILAISCEKGGSSVLADLYLVSGRASAGEERFAFGYGDFVQLLDDLQDVGPDLEAGHQTVFTRAAAARPARRGDRPACALHRTRARRRGGPGRSRVRRSQGPHPPQLPDPAGGRVGRSGGALHPGLPASPRGDVAALLPGDAPPAAPRREPFREGGGSPAAPRGRAIAPRPRPARGLTATRPAALGSSIAACSRPIRTARAASSSRRCRRSPGRGAPAPARPPGAAAARRSARGRSGGAGRRRARGRRW